MVINIILNTHCKRYLETFKYVWYIFLNVHYEEFRSYVRMW